jgi:hypothetical protein
MQPSLWINNLVTVHPFGKVDRKILESSEQVKKLAEVGGGPEGPPHGKKKSASGNPGRRPEADGGKQRAGIFHFPSVGGKYCPF